MKFLFKQVNLSLKITTGKKPHLTKRSKDGIKLLQPPPKNHLSQKFPNLTSKPSWLHYKNLKKEVAKDARLNEGQVVASFTRFTARRFSF